MTCKFPLPTTNLALLVGHLTASEKFGLLAANVGLMERNDASMDTTGHMTTSSAYALSSIGTRSPTGITRRILTAEADQLNFDRWTLRGVLQS